ncbi:MAG: hypothetical protein DI623_03065 [Sphingomonas sanxanigenens]|uniref:Uncharacterized protein n=1 Tax=Sphingomonas sanxanigenens TaxID=397260 RepID=A0A2W5AE30_9SPHN|nr:MAG: hypothetical protein DI623_03065 [Sphingomonas sanxanigenens]
MSSVARLYFSASAGGFFDEAVHGAAIPSDAVPVTSARHAELIAAQAGGAAIVAGKGGRPRIARAPATIAHRRMTAITSARREAQRRILAIAPLWRQANDNAAIALEALTGAARDVDAALDRRHRIDALRDCSDALEAAIALMDAAALDALQIADDAHWGRAA